MKIIYDLCLLYEQLKPDQPKRKEGTNTIGGGVILADEYII